MPTTIFFFFFFELSNNDNFWGVVHTNHNGK